MAAFVAASCLAGWSEAVRGAAVEPVVIIGDVHGCLDELRALVHGCGGERSARFVLVGDLVAKGPDSVGVVAYAREHGFSAVMGNHDDKVVRSLGDASNMSKHARIAQM